MRSTCDIGVHKKRCTWDLPNLVITRLFVPESSISITQFAPLRRHKIQYFLLVLRETVSFQQFLLLRVRETHEGRARWLGRLLFGIILLRSKVIFESKDLYKDSKISHNVREWMPFNLLDEKKPFFVSYLAWGRGYRHDAEFYGRDTKARISCKSEALYYRRRLNASVSIDRQGTWSFAGTPSLKEEKNVKTSDKSMFDAASRGSALRIGWRVIWRARHTPKFHHRERNVVNVRLISL